MEKKTYGDGTNLPKNEVLVAQFIVTTHFTNADLKDKPFSVYFEAEKSVASGRAPFDIDDLFGAKYQGKIGQRI